MNETDLDDVVDSHLSEVFTGVGEMVTKWVAVVEVIDDQGRRWLRTLAAPEMPSWDRIGLLSHTVAEEQAIVASAVQA